jgi:hypothetical protein
MSGLRTHDDTTNDTTNDNSIIDLHEPIAVLNGIRTTCNYDDHATGVIHQHHDEHQEHHDDATGIDASMKMALASMHDEPPEYVLNAAMDSGSSPQDEESRKRIYASAADSSASATDYSADTNDIGTVHYHEEGESLEEQSGKRLKTEILSEETLFTGMDPLQFPKKVNNEQWDLTFTRLISYKGLHGDCLVPKRFAADPKLGTWVETQVRIHTESLNAFFALDAISLKFLFSSREFNTNDWLVSSTQ